jgi:hypothetical protein
MVERVFHEHFLQVDIEDAYVHLVDTDPAGGRGSVDATVVFVDIANVFEGNPTRATGTPGHEESVEYVVDKMEAAGFEVGLQPFEADIFFEQAPAVFEQVAPNPTVYQRYDGQNGVWYTADFSGDGDVTAPAVAVDFVEPTPVPSTSNSGCEPEDFGPEWSARSRSCSAAPATSASRSRTPRPPARSAR